jgi:hypothetical protein
MIYTAVGRQWVRVLDVGEAIYVVVLPKAIEGTHGYKCGRFYLLDVTILHNFQEVLYVCNLPII